jgi:hypothetical protein
MSYSSTYTCPNQVHARRDRYFRWLAISIICVALFASFRIGLVRGLSDSIGQASWGRVLFAVGAAVTEMEHGGYGYTTSNVVETVLIYAGLVSDSEILAKLGTKFPDNLKNTPLMNAAIDKAVHFKWPFNPNEQVRGSAGDDLGFVDYTRLSFYLFGFKISSLYFTYFVIFGISVSAFVHAFRDRPNRLALIVVICVANGLVLASGLMNPDKLGALADPRFLSILAIVPGLHLCCLMLDEPAPSSKNAALAVLQSLILIFAFWIRASAIWVIFATILLAVILTIHELRSHKFKLLRLWSIGIFAGIWTLQALYVSIVLHPVYKQKGEITHHVLWHSVFYPLQFHPKWNAKYAAQYDNATFDVLPQTAAIKYLLRNPPSDPDSVYLTPDRKYLRVSAAETYIRAAFFEFLFNDPKFVLEALFIYNPIRMTRILTDLLNSTRPYFVLPYFAIGSVFLIMAGFLTAVDAEWRRFRGGVLLVTAAFFVSLLPVLPTAPDYTTVGDQYFMLLVMLGSWAMFGMCAGLRGCAGLVRSLNISPTMLLPRSRFTYLRHGDGDSTGLACFDSQVEPSRAFRFTPAWTFAWAIPRIVRRLPYKWGTNHDEPHRGT